MQKRVDHAKSQALMSSELELHAVKKRTNGNAKDAPCTSDVSSRLMITTLLKSEGLQSVSSIIKIAEKNGFDQSHAYLLFKLALSNHFLYCSLFISLAKHN